MIILPESPRHLLFHGKVEEARNVVAKLNSTTVDSAITTAAMAELQEGLAEENDGGSTGWKELLQPGVRERVLIGMCLQTLQQFNGKHFLSLSRFTPYRRSSRASRHSSASPLSTPAPYRLLTFSSSLSSGQNFYYYYGDSFFSTAGTGLSPYAVQAVLGRHCSSRDSACMQANVASLSFISVVQAEHRSS